MKNKALVVIDIQNDITKNFSTSENPSKYEVFYYILRIVTNLLEILKFSTKSTDMKRVREKR